MTKKTNKSTTIIGLLFLMIIAIFLSIGFSFFDGAKDRPIKTVVDGFFTSLVQKDYNAALEYCTGEQAYTLVTNLTDTNLDDGFLEKINYGPLNINQNLAEVTVTAEVIAGVKSYVQRYLVHLIKQDKTWNIYLIEKTHLALPEKRQRANEQQIKEVYLNYLLELANNNWAKAANFLIDNALDNHLQMIGVLSKESLFKTYTSPTLYFLAGDQKTCIYNLEYKIDERHVDVLVTFYHTQNGWKIARINQV